MNVREAFADRELLVTGVTGFVGKVWVAFLLESVPTLGRLHLVVRPKARGSAKDRFQRMVERSPAFRPLRAAHGTKLHEWLEEKVQIHEGDCTKPGMGIQHTAPLAGLDGVIHFAGLTDFQPDPALGLPTNVRGALHAADVATRLPTPRLFHISTAFVAGNQSGVIQETISPGTAPNGVAFDPDAELRAAEAASRSATDRNSRIDAVSARATALGYPNGYTYTKGLAEHLLSQRRDIQLTVLRPTVVESARTFPFPGWNEGVNTSGPIVWLMSSWLRRLPAKADNHFDVIPVDTAARGITLAVAKRLTDTNAPSVYHLGSSAQNPLTFERTVELNSLAYRAIHRDSASSLERVVKSRLGGSFVDPDEPPFPTGADLRGAARQLLNALRHTDLKRFVTASYAAQHPGAIERKKRAWSQHLRNLDRTLKRTEEMLELYRPFIHDNDYVFLTDHVSMISDQLRHQEREIFGFDIEALCWRHYWMDIHVPGLEQWTIPLLKGERPREDPPFATTPPQKTPLSLAEGA